MITKVRGSDVQLGDIIVWAGELDLVVGHHDEGDLAKLNVLRKLQGDIEFRRREHVYVGQDALLNVLRIKEN